MKTTLRELQKDLLELKEKHNLEKPSNSITKDDMYHLSRYLTEKNPRIRELLKEIGDHLAINNSCGLIDGTIKPDLENPVHKKYIELHNENRKLKMIEYEKWKAPLTDKEAYNRIITRSY